jgi:hypothetical protein
MLNSDYELTQLWKYHPQITDINALDDLVDATIRPDPASGSTSTILGGARFLLDRRSAFDNRLAFAKGLVGLSLAAWFVTLVLAGLPQIDPRRPVAVLAILFVAILFLATARIRAYREYATQKVRDFVHYKQATTSRETKLDEPKHIADVLKTLRQDADKGIWTLRLWAYEPAEDVRELGLTARRALGRPFSRLLRRGVPPGPADDAHS